jgi:uncharacterized membrane protein HdeD (DUF308 family)
MKIPLYVGAILILLGLWEIFMGEIAGPYSVLTRLHQLTQDLALTDSQSVVLKEFTDELVGNWGHFSLVGIITIVLGLILICSSLRKPRG